MSKEETDSPFGYRNLAYDLENAPSPSSVENGGRARNRTRSEVPPLVESAKSAGDKIDKDITTPDKLLALYGSKNVYLVFVWLVMAAVWGLTAMPMMVSAFLMSPPCAVNAALNGSTAADDCVDRNGSMARQFNLFGDRAKLGDYTTSAFLIGDTIGSIILPPLSDKTGRRPILLISMALYGVIGILASFSPEIYSFIVLRFLQGLFFTGAGVTSWVLAYESIPIRLRSFTTLSFGLFWVTGYCMVAPLAVFIESWRWLVVAVSAPCLLAGIFYYFLARQLFSNRILLLNLFVMVYLWTCDAFVYYGLSLFSTQLAGNRYMNFILMGLIEIPSYVVSPILLNKFGRRKFMSLVHFLATCSFFVVAVHQNSTLNLLMWLLGKFAIASAFTSLFVYSSELFPTVVRNACLGVCSVVARLGGALAPAVQVMVLISPIMPTVFFGICALIGCLLTLFLPETLNRELPDSPDQIN